MVISRLETSKYAGVCKYVGSAFPFVTKAESGTSAVSCRGVFWFFEESSEVAEP